MENEFKSVAFTQVKQTGGGSDSCRSSSSSSSRLGQHQYRNSSISSSNRIR